MTLESSSLAAISRQIAQSTPVQASAAPFFSPSPLENAKSPNASALVARSPSANQPSSAAPSSPHVALDHQSSVISVHLTLLPRAAAGIALIPLRSRGCMIVLPFLSDQRLLLGDALLLQPDNIREGGSQLLSAAAKSASLSISVSSPLKIFALNNRVVILPVGSSGLMDMSAAWIINVEKASLSKALGPSASSKFQGASCCSVLDRFLICFSSDVATMVLDSDTQLVKNGSATNLPQISGNQLRFMFSAAAYAFCASVASSCMETGHYRVAGFVAQSVSYCDVSDPRNLAFKSFEKVADHVFDRAFIVLGATGFYVLALYDNDGDTIDLLRSLYFDVRSGASFSVDSDGSVSRLLQSSGNMLPRRPIRCTPKSMSILCGNVNHVAVLVISSSQLELLRCPVDLPPRTRSYLCSCAPSSPVGWIICLDHDAVPLVLLRVAFEEVSDGNILVARSKIEQVSAVLPSIGVSLLGDGAHTVVAVRMQGKDCGDALCVAGRHISVVNDCAGSASSVLSSSDQRLGSLV